MHTPTERGSAMATPTDNNQNNDQSKFVEPDKIVDRGSTPQNDSEGDSLLGEALNWVRDVSNLTDRTLRKYVIFPVVAFGVLYTIAEVLGINEILWGLLAVLFLRSIAIVWWRPSLLVVLSLNQYSSKVISFYLIEFVLELVLIIIGLVTPLHELEPVALRFFPILCLIGVLVILLREALKRRKLPEDITPVIRWVFIVIALFVAFAVVDRLLNLEALY